ncbi:TIGR00730 family Rossman fold protein [Streptomyces lunaelactis]|uniref:Cytokinin riboside 5'-monophosphate phosphoribohydrolase n=1 Tax=Streptomyces lunaelactis TaxID=1535768 RepID=A0A2R4TDE3_9ACTN|nr:TIGR00730 family Rossman fold protein [Streptomyces lunaelactis]NUK27804.1 TIGR00730 family Rossman fold protein [Streptomyces lunaelactis]NUK88344.1 TIGR00730 family Rossman fold protein [Streptomyces lunaelactis]
MRVAVFCGAARPADPVHLQEAATIGRLLAEHSIHIVMGGSRLGLMGALADAALAAGGQVTGIIPRPLNTPRITHPGLTSLETVPDMTSRKQRFVDLADAYLALPGGFGTLDELAHVWAGAAHGARARPVGLLNTSGYYTPLLTFLNHAAAGGFLTRHPDLRLDELAVVDDDPARLLQSIAARIDRPTATRHAMATLHGPS